MHWIDSLEERRHLSGLAVTYNSNGISTLAYNGDVLIDVPTYGSVDGYQVNRYYTLNADGVSYSANSGSSGVSKSWDSTSNTLKYNYAFGSIAVQYVQQGNDRLNMIFTVTNNANSGVTLGGVDIYPGRIHFPYTLPYSYGTSWSPMTGSEIDGPNIIPANYTSSDAQHGATMAFVNDSDPTQSIYTSLWTVVNNGLYYYMWVGTGPKDAPPSSEPIFYRNTAPGQTDIFEESLRFGPASTDPNSPYALAADTEQAYAAAYPNLVNWNDRRPIGSLHLTSPPTASNYVNNPEGWFNAVNTDYTSGQTALNNFASALLNYANTSLAILKNNNAQGMIVWDVEGQRWPQATTYIGDASLATSIQTDANAPASSQNSIEKPVVLNNGTQVTPMGYLYTGTGSLKNPVTGAAEPLIDQFFQIFSRAGFRTGLTVRPTQITFDGSAAPSGSSTVVTNAPQQSNPVAPQTEANLLEAKIQYAYTRWGCTLFYLDSNSGVDRDALRQVQTDFPYILIIPEHASVSTYGTSAPYGQWLGHDYTGTPVSALATYSDAFSVIYPADGATTTDGPPTRTSIDRGDVILFRSWFNDSYNPLASGIYSDYPTPAAPTNVVAHAGDAAVTLSWNPVTVTGLNSAAVYPVCVYNIYRSTVSGSSYVLIAAGVSGTTYSDRNAATPIDAQHQVVNNQTYYYTVTASDAKAESAKSTQVSAKPIATPTVATAAHVVSTTSTTVNLSVLGASAAGESTLIYSWSSTSMPANLAQPTYSSNGTNSSKNMMVTFYQAGAYALTVTITDGNGLTVASSVNVTLAQVQSSVTVSPNSATVNNAQSTTLIATARDQFSVAMTSQPTFSWTIDNGGVGAVNPAGQYTAPASGPGSASVRATIGSISGTSLITVGFTQIVGTTGDDNIRLVKNGAALEVYFGSPAVLQYSTLIASIGSLTILTDTGNDTVQIDFSGSGSPVPTGGISVDGGTGTNSLIVAGTSGNDTSSVGGSSITFNGSFIGYSNIAALAINSGVGSDTLTQLAQPSAALDFNPASAAATLNINAGTFKFLASNSGIHALSFNSLSINPGAAVIFASDSNPLANRNVLVLDQLSIAGSAGNWQGTLDLGSNDLLVRNASLTQITSLISFGISNSSFGVISSAIAHDVNHLTTLGVVSNRSTAMFDNQPSSAGDVWVRPTFYGDADLSGEVDGNDYTQIDNGFNMTAAGWSNGDFNYDGMIDGSDYSLIDNAFNRQPPSSAATAALVIHPALPPEVLRQLNLAQEPSTSFSARFNDSAIDDVIDGWTSIER